MIFILGTSFDLAPPHPSPLRRPPDCIWCRRGRSSSRVPRRISQVEAGSVQWSSSDEAVATIAVDPENELKATVTAVGLGVAQILVSADADLDEGETRAIEGSGAIEVVAAEAETFEVVFGEPQDAE